MKTLKALSTKILAVLLLLPAMASAAPLLINYQGRLVDTAGNPLTGAQSILLRLRRSERRLAALERNPERHAGQRHLQRQPGRRPNPPGRGIRLRRPLPGSEDRRRRPADPAHAPALRALRAVRGQPRFSFQCGHRFHPHRRFRQPAAPG